MNDDNNIRGIKDMISDDRSYWTSSVNQETSTLNLEDLIEAIKEAPRDLKPSVMFISQTQWGNWVKCGWMTREGRWIPYGKR